MNPRFSTLLLAFGLTVFWPKPLPAAPLPPDAAHVAHDFLYAYSRNDRDTIKRMLPRSAANLHGPCPFSKMPVLTNPRVDERVAAVDFCLPSLDRDLPDRGTAIVRLVAEEGQKRWRVRQIYWYDELPKGVDVPDSSRTSADRRQEPVVRRAVFDFIRAWLAEDYESMEDLTFHWWNVPRPPPKWTRMVGLEVTGHPTALDGVRVDFDATLRVARLIPKRVRGTLWLVKEDGEWRVRPITFSLLF